MVAFYATPEQKKGGKTIIFAKRFKKERVNKNLTQKELADRFNTSKSNISRYENGNSIPGINTIKKYADFFGVSIDYLLGRTDIPHYNKIPVELQPLLSSDNITYLKMANQLKINNISPEVIRLFLDFYKALKSKINISDKF